MEAKMMSNKKALYGKMATSTILAGKLHTIKSKLPLALKIQCANILSTEITNQEIQRTMTIMGLIKSEPIDNVELL